MLKPGTPTQIFYVFADHLDTPRVITNAASTSQIRWRWLSEPFGNAPAEDNPMGLGAFGFNLRFPGQYYDAESGLHNNYHRDYDPRLGRYIQSDPIGLDGGINVYAYVDNDPISFVDPEGLTRNRGSGNPRSAVPNPGNQSGGWNYGRFYPSLGNAPPRTATYPVGSSRTQYQVPPRAQQPSGEVCGQNFAGHAFDQMQARGIPPSVAINAILTGTQSPGNTASTTQYFSAINNVTVVVNQNTGNVVTVRWGPPSGLGGM